MTLDVLSSFPHLGTLWAPWVLLSKGDSNYSTLVSRRRNFLTILDDINKQKPSTDVNNKREPNRQQSTQEKTFLFTRSLFRFLLAPVANHVVGISI